MPDANAIHCQLSRGGFSGERVFRLDTAGNEYVGAAPRHYCYTRQGKPLPDDQPAAGKAVAGLVLAQILRRDDGTLLVYLPDGAVVSVRADQVETITEVSPHVPVQP